MTDTTVMEYPHPYKHQRVLEKKAFAARQRAPEEVRNVPICGYVYIPRPTRGPKAKQNSTGSVLCYRAAGAGTEHHGSGLCDFHEVDQYTTVSAHLAKSRAGTQLVKEIAKRASLFGASVKVSPHEALMGELHRTAGIIAWLEQHLNSMVEEEGMEIDALIRQYTKITGWKGSVWIDIYQAERKHLVNVAATAIKAGVAERQIALAEAQGRLVAMIMLAFIHDPELALTPAQLMMAPQVVRKHLTALPSSTPAQTKVEDLFNDGAVVGARQRAGIGATIPTKVIQVEESTDGEAAPGS